MRFGLAISQSNIGREAGGPAFSGATGVKFWDCSRGYPGTGGTAFVDPEEGEKPFRPDGSNSHLPWAGARTSRFLGEDVRIISLSKDGWGIDRFTDYNGSPGEMYGRIQSEFSSSGAPPCEFVFAMLGESNDPATYQFTYDAALHLASELRNDGIIAPQAPVIFGGVVSPTSVDDAYRDLAKNEALFGYASNYALETYDGLHYTADSQYRLGHRFASALERFDWTTVNSDTMVAAEMAGARMTTHADQYQRRFLNHVAGPLPQWGEITVDGSVRLTEPGLYYFDGRAGAYKTRRHQVFLRDVDSGAMWDGQSGRAIEGNESADYVANFLSVQAVVEVDSCPREIELLHYFQDTIDGGGGLAAIPSDRDAEQASLTVRRTD